MYSLFIMSAEKDNLYTNGGKYFARLGVQRSILNRRYYNGVAVACFPDVQATERFNWRSRCVRAPLPLERAKELFNY